MPSVKSGLASLSTSKAYFMPVKQHIPRAVSLCTPPDGLGSSDYPIRIRGRFQTESDTTVTGQLIANIWLAVEDGYQQAFFADCGPVGLVDLGEKVSVGD